MSPRPHVRRTFPSQAGEGHWARRTSTPSSSLPHRLKSSAPRSTCLPPPSLRRLLPRVTVSASFGIGEVIFRDPSTDAITVLPRDSYRLTFSLGLDQLLSSPDHGRALVRLREAELEAARIRAQVSQRRHARQMHETATRQELALLADELVLVQQLVAYNDMLFAQGKTEFDVLARAKLQLLNLSRVIAQVSQRLLEPD